MHTTYPTHALLIAFISTTSILCTISISSPLTAWNSSLALLIGIPSLAILTLAFIKTKNNLAIKTTYTTLTGIILAILRFAPLTLPSPTLAPSTHTILAEVTSQPHPTPSGWHLELTDVHSNHTYTTSVRSSLLPDPNTPPSPGDTLQATIKLHPTPTRDFPHDTHPLIKLGLNHTHGHASLIKLHTLQPPSTPRYLSTYRLSLIHTIRNHHTPDQAAVILAMILGSKKLLPPHIFEPLAVTGTAHLLAISGLHVGTLAMILVLLLRIILTKMTPHLSLNHGVSRLTFPLVSLLLGLYILLIGAPTSAQRALLMILIAMGTYQLRRRINPLLMLSIAISALLLLDPWMSMQPALWLSASATVSILIAATQNKQNSTINTNTSIKTKLSQAIKISAFAWLGTAPFILHLQAEIPLLAIALNLILIPIVSALIFPLMLTGIALIHINAAVGHTILNVAADLLIQLAVLSDAITLIPHTTWRPGHLPLAMLLLTTPLTLIAMLKLSKSPKTSLLLAALTLTIIAFSTQANHPDEPHLRIDFIPVGQGDATLITLPDHTTILVDAGGVASTSFYDPGSQKVLPWLRHNAIQNIDIALLTHPDADHMFGLFAIARRATPTTFISATHTSNTHLDQLNNAMLYHGSSLATPDSSPLLSTITTSENNIIIKELRTKDVRIKIIQATSRHLSKNDQSIVLEIHYKNTITLLTGDMEQPLEQMLIPHLSPHIDVLKVPHHGSKTSSSPALLEHLQPKVAIFSCGLHNRYNHPHPTVLQRYNDLHIPTFRTDHHGLISTYISPSGEVMIKHTYQMW